MSFARRVIPAGILDDKEAAMSIWYEVALLGMFVSFFAIAIPLIALYISFGRDKREREAQAKEQERHILTVIKDNSEAISQLTATLESTVTKRDVTLNDLKMSLGRIHERSNIQRSRAACLRRKRHH